MATASHISEPKIRVTSRCHKENRSDSESERNPIFENQLADRLAISLISLGEVFWERLSFYLTSSFALRRSQGLTERERNTWRAVCFLYVLAREALTPLLSFSSLGWPGGEARQRIETWHPRSEKESGEPQRRAMKKTTSPRHKNISPQQKETKES